MSESTYKVVELIGTSKDSWEKAAKNAVETASKTLRDLRIAEVKDLDLKIEDGKIAAFRVGRCLSFKYEDCRISRSYAAAIGERLQYRLFAAPPELTSGAPWHFGQVVGPAGNV